MIVNLYESANRQKLMKNLYLSDLYRQTCVKKSGERNVDNRFLKKECKTVTYAPLGATGISQVITN